MKKGPRDKKTPGNSLTFLEGRVDTRTLDRFRDLTREMNRLGFPHLLFGLWATEAALLVHGIRVGARPAAGNAVDVVFPVDSWDGYRKAVGGLEGCGFRRGETEGVLTDPGGIQLSLWPFGEGIAPGECLVWETSRKEYSTAGLDRALTLARNWKVAEDLEILVPPVPQVLLVKIVFYLSRMEVRDLTDIVFLLEKFPEDPEIGIESAGTPESPVPESSLRNGAIRLGGIMRASLAPSHLRIVERFLEEIQVVHSPLISRILREEDGPSDGKRIEELFGWFDAFRQGLDPLSTTGG